MYHENGAFLRVNRICEGKISDGIADREFFFQFSAGSAFHRCVNVGWTAALYGRMAQDDHFHPYWPLKEHTCFSVPQKWKFHQAAKEEEREWREFFLFISRNKGLSQTWLCAELSVTQLWYALYREGSNVSKHTQASDDACWAASQLKFKQVKKICCTVYM